MHAYQRRPDDFKEKFPVAGIPAVLQCDPGKGELKLRLRLFVQLHIGVVEGGNQQAAERDMNRSETEDLPSICD